MNLTTSDEDRRFREEVRTWLHENKPREKRPQHGPEMKAFDLAWQKAQYDGGWAGIAWPSEYGGRGLSLQRQVIWHEEYAAAGAPPIGCLFVAMNHGGPTLVARGTPEQKAFHLPRILRGEAVWCQGFSEPGAGSDLAAVRATGVIDGDTLVINGQKVWTSYGQDADYQELLVRTDPSQPRHKGLTWVICPMKTPGVRPVAIKTLSGSEHFCEVFYDDVRIPLSNVVSGVNDGWSVAMTTLSFERGTGLIGWQIDLAQKVEKLVALAAGRLGNLEGTTIGTRLAIVRAEVNALRAMTHKLIGMVDRGVGSGVEGTVVSLFFGELARRVYELAIEVLGTDALERQPVDDDWTTLYLESFRYTIAGGTSQVRRNIIGERLLGLPREGK